ncbi:MAG: glycosyl transferase, family 2 [Candidatus Solibacter sp.]|nr:glycosyl transferase, family 2 [Candidatus Solibacter sp.]
MTFIDTQGTGLSAPYSLTVNPPKAPGSVRVTVVSPCYNEASVLPQFHARVSEVCRRVVPDYEIVLVDDGSSDETWAIMSALAARDPHLVCVSLSRNHGHQLALTAGLHYCRGERILIIDSDLQDPPELLEPMMKVVDDGYDVVYGMRRTRAGESSFKKATAFLFYRMLNAFADREIPKDTGDFRLITRRVLEILNAMPENHRFIRGMVSWAGFRQTPFLYDRQARAAGETKYPLRKMLAFALDAITSFSVKPLRLAFYAGMLLSGVSILLLAYSVYSYFATNTVRGWTSMIALMLIFFSVQFLFIGLIGEYLGRMYLEAKRRPLFVVNNVVYGGHAKSAETSQL